MTPTITNRPFSAKEKINDVFFWVLVVISAFILSYVRPARYANVWYNNSKMQRRFVLSSKRARLAVRFFTYGVMTITTVALTVLAIYYAMGYRFNQNSFTVEQGGVIEFRTEPSSANVTVDGVPINKQTPGRAFAQAGDHAVAMRLPGYRDWNKTVNVQPGQLLWLDYARFIPQIVTTTPVREFATLTAALPSPDRRWLLLQEAPTSPTFTLVDTADEKSPTFTTLTVPEAAFTKKDGAQGAFTLLEWDSGSRFVLLGHTVGDMHEVLRLDRSQPNDTVNVSRKFNFAMSAVHFGANSGNVVFAQTATGLHRLDIGSQPVDVPFAEGATQFAVYDNTVAFVAARGGEQIIGVYRDGKETELARAPAGAKVLVRLAEYLRHQYIAYTIDGVGYITRDPTGSQANTVSFTPGVSAADWLQFSPEGRFVVAGSATGWSSYDVETSDAHQLSTGFGRAPQWIDDYHLAIEIGGTLKIIEFDGQNGQDITSIAGGFAAVLNPNERAVFSVNKTMHGSYTVQVSGLVN